MNREKMTTQKKNIIVISLLSIVIYYSYQFPKYGDINFIIKNISILSLYSFILYIFVMRYYKKLLPKFNKRIFLQVYTLLTFGVLISIFSYAQIDIIKTHLPSILNCAFYDEYNNVLYESHYEDTCPELELISEIDGVLHYSGIEYMSKGITSLLGGNDYIYTGSLEGEILFDIYVKYEDEKIIEHTLQQTELAIFINNDIVEYIYRSEKYEIINTYNLYDFTTKKTYYYSEKEYDANDNITLDNFTHKEFLEEDGRYTIITADLTEFDREVYSYLVTTTYQDGDHNIIEKDLGILESSIMTEYNDNNAYSYRYRTLDPDNLIDTTILVKENIDTSYINSIYYYHVDVDNKYSLKLNYTNNNNYTIIDNYKYSHMLSDISEYSSLIYNPSTSDDTYIEIGSEYNELSKIKETSFGYTVIRYNTYNFSNLSIDHLYYYRSKLHYAYYLDYYQLLIGNIHYYDIIFPNNPMLDFTK